MRYLLILAFCLAVPAAPKPVDFTREVRPILSDNCFSCHGPDEKSRMGGLRLDTREGAAKAIAGGKILARIAHEKPALRMPPPASGRKLTDAQVALVKRWLEAGAVWRTHWSYSPPNRPEIPAVKLKGWTRNPIDSFVLARLEKEGLKPSPETDRSTLLRRVSFDLTGLPSTQEELAAFLADKSKDAYEKVVDRLLKSPHYGEKMAMQWLDLSRYADTHGYHIDAHRDMWPWREWVINSFNSNKPFNQFALEQLAGDLLPNPTREQRLATGFNRNHMINFEGGAIPEEYQTEYVIDRVEATANTFLGMTLGCARCHDHKYDPIAQRDFYRFFAFFNSIEEKGLDGRKGNAEPFLIVDPGQESEFKALDKEIEAKRKELEDKKLAELQTAWESERLASMPPPVTQRLVVHYEFDGSLADSSGNYRYGRTGKTEPTYTAGIIGKAATFNIEDRAFLAREFFTHDDYTFAVWMRPANDNVFRIMEKGPVKIYTEPTSFIPILKRGARLYFDFNGRVLRTKEKILYNDWSHIALLSGSAIYINGKPAELEVVNEKPAGPMANSEPLTIKEYQGQIDDLRYYSRRLSPREIGEIATHLPGSRLCEIVAAKRSKDESARLRAYYLANAAPEPYRTNFAELKRLEARRDYLELIVPTSMVMKEMEKPRDSFVLGRGDYRNKTEKVTPAVPAALPPLPPGAPANRLGLAQWITSPDHPLTARVAVNRYWQNYFGTGIVKTSEDFGSQGEAPSHPELLDWLATEFVQSGWDVRAIQRLIVTSATYRQSSKVTPDLQERDPENRLLAHMSRFRLPAELVRDNALAASGLLNGSVGGRSVYPYQPKGLWEEMAFGGNYSAQAYTQSTGPDLYRRSIYTFWKRTVPPATLSTFDAPDREKCTSRRAVTNTPLQALVLMNDPTYVEAARHLAERMIKEGGAKAEQRIAYAYRQVLSRKPAPRELTVLSAAARQQAGVYNSDPAAALKLVKTGESKFDPALNPAELAAWTNIATMILNLDEAITKE